MKYTLPAIALGCLLAAGCQNQPKPAASESVTDLSSPTPVAYVPPTQTVTPEPIVSAPVSASVAASGSNYTVKPGDTLWKIAASHYGDGKKWKQICDANPGLTPQKLKVGQSIVMP